MKKFTRMHALSALGHLIRWLTASDFTAAAKKALGLAMIAAASDDRRKLVMEMVLLDPRVATHQKAIFRALHRPDLRDAFVHLGWTDLRLQRRRKPARSAPRYKTPSEVLRAIEVLPARRGPRRAVVHDLRQALPGAKREAWASMRFLIGGETRRLIHVHGILREAGWPLPAHL